MQRTRSEAEVAFMVMRALAVSRVLWQHSGALPVGLLAAIVNAQPTEIAAAQALLCEEGVATVDGRGTVRLTERGARDVMPPRSRRTDDGLTPPA